MVKREVIIAAYDGARRRGLSVAEAVSALAWEGISLPQLIDAYRRRFLKNARTGDKVRLDELRLHAETFGPGSPGH